MGMANRYPHPSPIPTPTQALQAACGDVSAAGPLSLPDHFMRAFFMASASVDSHHNAEALQHLQVRSQGRCTVRVWQMRRQGQRGSPAFPDVAAVGSRRGRALCMCAHGMWFDAAHGLRSLSGADA